MVWVSAVLGLDNVSGRWYAFWSGFGGDLPIFAGLGAFVLHKNCHTPGCWRLGRHTGLCGKHITASAPA